MIFSIPKGVFNPSKKFLVLVSKIYKSGTILCGTNNKNKILNYCDQFEATINILDSCQGTFAQELVKIPQNVNPKQV